MTRRVALTGGIATGKSHVRRRLEQLGAATIDADALARMAAAPGTPGLAAIAERFGTGILMPNGSLDRKALGRIVFADRQARRDLEQIIHPAVHDATDAWFAALDKAGVPTGVADIPLLYETGRDADFELVIVAACDPNTQVERLMRRDNLTEAEARARIATQWPIGDKVRRADRVIDTNGSIEDTNQQIDETWQALTTKHL